LGNIVIQVDPGYSATIEDVIFDDQNITNVDNIDMIGNLTNSNAGIVFNKGSTQSIAKTGSGNLDILNTSIGDINIGTNADRTGAIKLGNASATGDVEVDSVFVSTKNIVMDGGSSGGTTYFKIGNNGFYISIFAPQLTGNYNFKLPPNNGDPGQVLTTDGNGNTTWTTP
jgi:hypothetical protein